MFRSLYILVLILFASRLILASDQWLCTEEASQRQGDAILACGIGTGVSEASAREDAFNKAADEFKRICSQSNDCDGHEIKLNPTRNTCGLTKDGAYRCYRGLRYEIGLAVNPNSYLEQQQKLLDAEIANTESKLDELRTVKEKEEKLAKLRNQVETGHPDEGPERTEDPSWVLGFGVGYSGSHVDNGVGAVALEAFVEKRLSRSVGIRLQVEYTFWNLSPESLSNQEQPNPNSSQNITSSISGTNYIIGVPFYLTKAFFLMPEVGYSLGSVTQTTITYNPFSVGTATGTVNTSTNQILYGVGLGFAGADLTKSPPTGIYIPRLDLREYQGSGGNHLGISLSFGAFLGL